MSEQILTEEELYKIENSYGIYLPGLAERYPDVVNLIASHRELYKANAELSFKNMQLKQENEQITKYSKILESVVGVKYPELMEESTHE